jgi:hypothetical protein
MRISNKSFMKIRLVQLKKSKKVMNQSMKEARQKAAKLLFDAESNLNQIFANLENPSKNK